MRRLFPRLLILVLLSAASGCQPDIATIDIGVPEKLPTESAKDVEVVYSDSGRPQIKLFGPRLDRYEVPVRMFEMTEGVFIEFYDDSGKVKSWMRANYGISYELEEKMEAKYNVIVMNEKGEKLETDHLIWTRKEGRLFTDKHVKITRQDEIIHGNGLEATEDFSSWTILNTIGTYYMEESNDTIQKEK